MAFEGNDSNRGGVAELGRATRRRVLVIATEALNSAGLLDEIVNGRSTGEIEVRVVAPAVEATPLRHTMGDIDEPVRQAHGRLEASLATLRRRGIAASGAVGDPDPLLAAEDALREQPADEVVVLAHVAGQALWFEDGLFERVRESLVPPLRMVSVQAGDHGDVRVAEVERAGAGTSADAAAGDISISANFPRVARGDLAGMVIGIVGTIVAIVLAAAGPGPQSGWGATAILVAVGISLVNMAHVVGLTLLESVEYRGGLVRFLRALSLIGTPLAILVNLLIVLFA